jgi:hypothetical protein
VPEHHGEADINACLNNLCTDQSTGALLLLKSSIDRAFVRVCFSAQHRLTMCGAHRAGEVEDPFFVSSLQLFVEILGLFAEIQDDQHARLVLNALDQCLPGPGFLVATF